jgi:hypothetical protein
MFIQAFIAEGREELPPLVIHEEIYDMMVSHVRDAINSINVQTQEGITPPCNQVHVEGNTD